MHGVVNQAIEGLIIERYGSEAWNEICIASDCQGTTFYNNQNYSDSLTYTLAVNASKLLEIELSDLLFEFGRYWVLTIANEKYNALLQSVGTTLSEFLIQLPNFHSRVMLYYPNIIPPEFKVIEKSPQCIHLYYYSKRSGLHPFVTGILDGLKSFFASDCSIQLIEIGNEGEYHKSLFEIVS
ncbi:MAG: hypothetical protein RLZZ500_2593 [Bacteroidota bacterium]|jgi:hypothetical protein